MASTFHFDNGFPAGRSSLGKGAAWVRGGGNEDKGQGEKTWRPMVQEWGQGWMPGAPCAQPEVDLSAVAHCLCHLSVAGLRRGGHPPDDDHAARAGGAAGREPVGK